MVYVKYVKKKYEKPDLSGKDISEKLSFYFQECSKNYSNYLSHYFTSEGGVLGGFRFIDA